MVKPKKIKYLPLEPKARVAKSNLLTANFTPPKIQDPGDRAKILVEKHGPAKILKALNDEDFLAEEFSTYDGMIIVAIGAALRGSGEERERLFNRMFGKVADKQINLNVNVETRPEQLSERAHELLARITGNQDLEEE